MVNNNLVPRVFVPYCAGLTKRATLESSVTRSILIGLKDNTNGGSKIPRSSLVIHLKAGHAQLNRKSATFGLQIDLSRVARFTTAGQQERRPWVRGARAQIEYFQCRRLSFLGLLACSLKD